jgi:RNA-directed DNA polymerase
VSIYKKSNKAAERTLESITSFIEKKLLLKVNRTKSKISRPTGSKLLGFSFYKTKTTWGIRIAKSSVDRLKLKLKAISKRNNGKNFKTKLGELKPVITGWVNYFRLADAKKNMENLDGMLRTRLRMGIWKEWKNCKTRVKNLRKLGIDRQKSYEWGNTSRGYCRVAHSPILCRALNNDYFRNQGYEGFSDMYEKKTKLPIPFS